MLLCQFDGIAFEPSSTVSGPVQPVLGWVFLFNRDEREMK